MISDNRNGACLYAVGALAVGLILALSGCSSHEQQQENLSEAQAAAMESLSTDSAGTEGSSTGGGSTEDSSSTGESGTDWENALPEDLDAGEIALSRTDNQSEVAFQGTAPDLSVTFGDQDLYWICVQDSESGETTVLAEVTSVEDSSGMAAWLDARNNEDLKDPNTVIHGNATEGNVFANLTDYGDVTFFDSNPFLYVYTVDSVREYQVFAAYTAAEEDILAAHDCADFDVFSGYVNDIFEQRSMSAVLNAELRQSVLDSWCVLTLEGKIGNGQSFLVQAIPSGIQYLQ